MSNEKQCLPCPREAAYQNSITTLVKLREILSLGSEAALDDESAEELAALIKDSGLLPGMEVDASSMRHFLLGGFEFADQLEEKMFETRREETQFCAGALRMRASDSHTEYTVAICRSPKQDDRFKGDVQLAVVNKRSIN